MAMLDRRLKRMEDRVIKYMPKPSTKSIIRTVVRPSVAMRNIDSKKRAAQEAFSDELATLARIQAPEGSVKGSDSGVDDIMTDGREFLPSPELQLHLSEVFFDYVYGQSYHLLHRPSYMRKLRANQLAPVVVLSVCAISARFSNHPAIKTEPVSLRGEEWAKPARDIAVKRYDTPNLAVLIAYIILALHEFGTCQGGISWMLAGMAYRMAFALQLHKLSQNNSLSFTDQEQRRRVIWACYKMDRFTSSGVDRPLTIKDSDIEVGLPVEERLFQMELPGSTEKLWPETSNETSDMGVAAYTVRAISIWGKVARYFNQGGKEKEKHDMWSEQSVFYKHDKKLTEFLKTLPDRLQWNENNLKAHDSDSIANQFIFLHILIHQSRLVSNQFAVLQGGPSNMPAEFLQEHTRIAIDAATKISYLVRDALQYRCVVPFAGFCAYQSSTVHVHGCESKSPVVVAKSRKCLSMNLAFLGKMQTYWAPLHFTTEHLREMCHKQTSNSLSPDSAIQKPGIVQYGDWFAKYPHGQNEPRTRSQTVKIKLEPDNQITEDDQRKVLKKRNIRADLTRRQGDSLDSNLNPTSNPSLKNSINTNIPQLGRSMTNDSSFDSGLYSPPIAQTQPLSSPFVSTTLRNNLQLAQLQQMQSLQNPGLMADLDRRMVMSSYTGVEGPNMNVPPMIPLGPINTEMFTQMPPSSAGLMNGGLGSHVMLNRHLPAGQASGGDMQYQDQNSFAWFTPFNMEHPSTMIGDFVPASYDFPSNLPNFNMFDLNNTTNYGG